MKINNYRNETSKSITRVSCDVDGEELYFEFPEEYNKYTVRNIDSFILLMLPLAMIRKENIYIDESVSEKLYHNIVNYLMKIINLMWPDCAMINIYINKLNNDKYYSSEVGCGLSCGVDSLCCLEDYYFNESCSTSYKLTYVTNFKYTNIQNLHKYHDKTIKYIEDYLKNTTLKLLTVVSNVNKINTVQSHNLTHTFKNCSIPLLFPRLFNKYYYASGDYSYVDCGIRKNCTMARIDPMIINLFSTENTEFISHGCQYTRPEKTLKISSNPLTQKYLQVCIVYSTKNCSKCSKCLATLITLDYYNVVDYFHERFDLDIYRSHKEEYINNLNINNPLHKDIVKLYKSS